MNQIFQICNDSKAVAQPHENNQKGMHSQQDSHTDISKRDFIQSEEAEMKEIFSPSSDGILLRPSFTSGEEFEEQAGRKARRSAIGRFLASYSEITTAASLLRQRVIFLLSIFVCSTAALENNNMEKVIPVLFGASYFGLGYQIIENLIKCRYLKTVNSGSQKMECIFEMANRMILILSILSFNLQYYGVISQIFMLLSPLLFTLEVVMYLKNSSRLEESQGRDDMKIVEKVFFMVQSFMIAAKMNNLINFEWETNLIFLWIYLGMHSACIILTALLLALVISASILSFDTETLGLLKSKILGYIFHISYFGLNVVGLIILTGIFEKIRPNEESTIQIGLLCAKRLSLFLVIYTVLLFPILKRFKIRPFEDLRITLQNQVVSGASQKKYTLIRMDAESKIAFFSMVSATYFNLLSDFSHEQCKETDLENSKEEENLCFICESNGANAILGDCGHGGVCCDCAVKLIEQKNECMGCRKPAKVLYKIENLHSRNEKGTIIKASELIQILEV